MNRPAKKTMNYLHHKLGYSQKTARKIIWAYAKEKGIEGKEEAQFIEVGNLIQNDWDAFMNFYGSKVKGVYKKGGGKDKNHHGLSDLQEALQYTNGSADDF